MWNTGINQFHEKKSHIKAPEESSSPAPTAKTENETDEKTSTPKYNSADKIHDLLKVAMALTDVNGLASDLSPYDFAIRLVSDCTVLTWLKSE